MKMQRKLKKRWIEALLSGRYAQGKGSLCNHDNKYCCIGVLGRVQEVSIRDLQYPKISHLTLPKGKNAGLTHAQRKKLANLNDGDEFKGITPKSFKEIAAYIQKHF